MEWVFPVLITREMDYAIRILRALTNGRRMTTTESPIIEIQSRIPVNARSQVVAFAARIRASLGHPLSIDFAAVKHRASDSSRAN